METFDPKDEQYKEVADLPQGHQEEFMDVKGGGFVSRDAVSNKERAEITARAIELSRKHPQFSREIISLAEDMLRLGVSQEQLSQMVEKFKLESGYDIKND